LRIQGSISSGDGSEESRRLEFGERLVRKAPLLDDPPGAPPCSARKALNLATVFLPRSRGDEGDRLTC
jgi:hypothetical protein